MNRLKPRMKTFESGQQRLLYTMHCLVSYSKGSVDSIQFCCRPVPVSVLRDVKERISGRGLGGRMRQKTKTGKICHILERAKSNPTEWESTKLVVFIFKMGKNIHETKVLWRLWVHSNLWEEHLSSDLWSNAVPQSLRLQLPKSFAICMIQLLQYWYCS